MEPTKKSAPNTSAFTPSSGEKPELPSLPKELMDDIFSMLSEEEMKDATTTNKFWNEKTLEYVKNEQYVSLKSLAGWIISNLNEGKVDQKNALQTAISDTTILESENLPDVKLGAYGLEKKILDVLMGLDELELLNMEKKFNSENKLPQHEKLFDLILVYKEIETIKNLPLHERNYALRNIPAKLVALKQFDKAIAIYNTLSTTDHKEQALLNMMSEMEKNGVYDAKQQYADVKKIINLITTEEATDKFWRSSKEKVFGSLCFQLFRNNQPDKAVEIATIYSLDTILNETFYKIIEDKSIDIDIAFKVVELIQDPALKKSMNTVANIYKNIRINDL